MRRRCRWSWSPDRRVVRGLQGLAGLRGDAPSEARWDGGCGAGGRWHGQGGPRDRSFRAEGSRVAISRAGRRPPAHRAATESKTCACAARKSGGVRRAKLVGTAVAVPVVMVARSEGGARPAGPGRASRRHAERSSQRGRRAGGQASRRTEVWRDALRAGLAGCAERSSRRGRRAGGQASCRTEVWRGALRGGLAGRRPPAHRAATESKTCACVARMSGRVRRTEIWRGARSCSRDWLLRGPVLLSSHPQLVLL